MKIQQDIKNSMLWEGVKIQIDLECPPTSDDINLKYVILDPHGNQKTKSIVDIQNTMRKESKHNTEENH